MTAISTDTTNAIVTFAACIFDPRDILEVRMLSAGRSIFTTAGELAGLSEQLKRDNDAGQNIYVGVNARKQIGDGSKASECDGTKCGKCDRCVNLARCLFADFDNTTPEQVRERLAATKLLTPTITIFSGHGVHCYWRLTEPIRELESWTGFQKDLAALLDSDHTVHNPSRIMRLPGFQNIKPEKGPPVMSHIIEVADENL